MSTDDLRPNVEAQAAARVRDDTATFASYMTPQAILQLGAASLPEHHPRRSQILDISSDASLATSDVRYAGGGWSYVLRTSWRFTDGLWRASAAELVAGTLKPSFWKRVLRRASRSPEPSPPRRDLS
jgi:hypothetical protein